MHYSPSSETYHINLYSVDEGSLIHKRLNMSSSTSMYFDIYTYITHKAKPLDVVQTQYFDSNLPSSGTY